MTSSSPSAIEDGSKIVSLSSKIMVATILFIFIMVVFLFAIYLYTKWYNSRHENPTIVSWRRQTARQRRSATSTQLRGLENSTLVLLPSVEYKAKDLNEKLECSVCLCEVLEGEKIRVLPKCSHKFHVECIDMWFSSHSSCPLCRTPVVSHSSHDINDVVLQQSGGGAGNASNFDDYHVHGVQLETNALPTNTMSLENEAQVSPIMAQAKVGSEQDKNAIASSSSSNSIDVSRLRDGLAIEIPSDLCHDCLSSPLSGARFDEDEPRSPSLTTFRSLKRLLSRGKRVLVPSPTASSSAHV